jgi:hemerythrin
MAPRGSPGILTGRIAGANWGHMAFAWDPALSVGVDELDVQHRTILRRMRRAGAALTGRRLATAVAEVRFLERYLAEHFAAEERWMHLNAYPGAREHERAHRAASALAAAARELVVDASRRSASDLGVEAAMLDELGAWLDAHLRDEDLRLGRWRVMRENLRKLGAGGRPTLTPVPELPGRRRGEA